MMSTSPRSRRRGSRDFASPDVFVLAMFAMIAPARASTWGEAYVDSNSANFMSFSSSTDGSKIFAVAALGEFFHSSDSGTSWTGISSRVAGGSLDWQNNDAIKSVHVSADGTTVLVLGEDGTLYRSTDSGGTFSVYLTSLKDKFANDHSATASFSHLRVPSGAAGTIWAVYRNGIYMTIDSGVSWSETLTAPSPTSVTDLQISDANDRMVATIAPTTMKLSNDGMVWSTVPEGTTDSTMIPTQNGWSGLTMSSDGTKIAAVGHINNDGTIYVSTDSGATWTDKSSVGADSNGAHPDWYAIASSPDFSTLYVGPGSMFAGNLYTSVDDGSTWTEVPSTTQPWNVLARLGNAGFVGGMHSKIWLKIFPAATCDASGAITNGSPGSACTAALASGSSCTPTCDAGHTLSGTRSCNAGTLTDTATCAANPPPTSNGPSSPNGPSSLNSPSSSSDSPPSSNSTSSSGDQALALDSASHAAGRSVVATLMFVPLIALALA